MRIILLYYNIVMILIEVPGRTPLEIHHLVCDVNGTLAVDGEIMDGIQESMNILKESLDIYLLTADTHGKGEVIGSRPGGKGRNPRTGE